MRKIKKYFFIIMGIYFFNSDYFFVIFFFLNQEITFYPNKQKYIFIPEEDNHKIFVPEEDNYKIILNLSGIILNQQS